MSGQRGPPTPIMDTNSLLPLKDQKEKPSLLIEVANVEKQLWALILTKDLLHSDVQALYQKACSSYEKIILNDLDVPELHEVEYSLWKLHYRHINEFRNRIKKNLANEEATKSMASQSILSAKRSNNNHVEGFKSFLLEASKFYQNLIRKVKGYYRLPEDFSFCRGVNSVSVEPKKMQKLQYFFHRFLVCLGDLARYREQCEKSDIQSHNWSVAVAHYLEATQIWPHSGNPQNQLAVLATYVGDEFLALYHCMRSLAVREPFPDAWNNLILLFERNRSFHLHSLSNEAHFDFLNPSECTVLTNSQSTDGLSNCEMVQAEHEGSGETHMWPLFIRMISFFFIKSSLDGFPYTFASAIKELDMLMMLDDAKLKAVMESYQHMGSTRSGPFRALQVVSVFIFVIENVMNSVETRDSKNNNETPQFELIREILTAAFIFMGRLVDRCLKGKILHSCPLLPALLVFSEWLVGILDEAEIYASNEKVTSAMSYFFGTFLELLKRFDVNMDEAKPPSSIALWEDYELRGFAPLACSHMSLDFSNHWAHADSYECGTEYRAHRITSAAIKIADRSSNKLKWIFYDKSGRIFSLAEPSKSPYRTQTEKAASPSTIVEMKESHQHIYKSTEESEKIEEEPGNSHMLNKSIAMEDEEVILFKPLTRYNSAPLYSVITANGQMTSEDTTDQIVPADECLRRATSLLIAQNQAQGDPPAFHSDLTNFRCNKPLQQQEPLVQDTVAVVHPFSKATISSGPPSFSHSISAGPPSLNAWVLNRGSSSTDKAKGKRDANKHSIPPIEEMASASPNDLSTSDTENSVTISRHDSVIAHNSSAAYSAPLPSAPFLPDDVFWSSGIQSTFSGYNGSGTINKISNFFDASQASGYSNRTVSHQPIDYSIPGFTDGYPASRRMTSSEWLRQYRENHNLEWVPSHAWLAHPYAAMNTGNFYDHDISRSGLFDQLGAPLGTNILTDEENPPFYSGFSPVYGAVEHRREKLYPGFQRLSPYGRGAVNEPEPLLQYLKEKEWLLQQDPTLRGPTYMGS